MDADIVLDVRFLPNPFFVEDLKELTGLDEKVAGYVLSFEETQKFLGKLEEMLIYLLPLYIAEGKSYLTVALGCTGGAHRSVALVEELNKRLSTDGYRLLTNHRDIKEN